jgi:predicted acyltransferase
MILVNNPGSWSYVYPPLLHAKWHGWTFTDLIFPFFLVIVGVSIALALAAKKDQPTLRPDLYKKIAKRTFLLFCLGLFLNGFPFFDISNIRIPGVLQRIAVCYFFSALIFLHAGIKVQAIWAVALMMVYWAFMVLVPFPGHSADPYEVANNFSAWLDNLLLHGHMWTQSKTWDPEGVFSTLPAISTTLAGVLTGQLLRRSIDPLEKVSIMLIAGNTAIALGLIWHHWLPINKSLWTSSYALFMSGMALVFLAISYYLIDLKGWRKGIQPFCVYGMNAITVFVLSGIVGRLLYLIKWDAAGEVVTLKEWLVNNLFLNWLSPINASLAYALSFVFLSYLAMYYLYKKHIFIKV